jgi:hypothetical protein
MGKRRRRLNSAKYAKKYASVRASVAKLKGVVAEATSDGVITPDEAVQIAAAEQEVANATAAAVVEVVKEVVPEPVAEVVPEPVAEVVEEVVPDPPKAVKKQTVKKADPKKARKTRAKKSTSRG